MLDTQLDIAYAITRLSQFSVNPSKKHLSKVLYICCYLAGTKDYVLIYNGNIIKDWKGIQIPIGDQTLLQEDLQLDSSFFWKIELFPEDHELRR